MKKVLSLILIFSCFLSFAQFNSDESISLEMSEENWLKVDRVLSLSTPDSISTIKPLDVLRYLASEKYLSESNIKSVKYIFPKSWISKNDVEILMCFVSETKPSKHIQHSWSATASPEFSTVGFEAMRLIKLFTIPNYRYPKVNACFEFDKPQSELAKEVQIWWKNQ